MTLLRVLSDFRYIVKLGKSVSLECFYTNILLLYSYLHVHSASQRHNIKDRLMKENAWRKEAGRKTQEDFFRKIFTSHFIARVRKGLHVRGCWRLNINFIFWPHCYDRHAVSFLFSWSWGPFHRGFPRTPRSGVAFPTTSRLYCLEFCWQLLWDPNSTELNNNSTPTRLPTGSSKSDV